MGYGKADITVTLPSGTRITGRVEEVRKTLKSLGLDPTRFLHSSGFYYSESRREYIAITEMNTTHLRNALLKA